MRLTWEQRDGWFDREYVLIDKQEAVVEELGDNPSLRELRELERKHGERIDLWQTGLICSECGNEVNGRFGATPQGEIVCFECGQSNQSSEESGLTVNTDPAKATLSESELHKKSLCDYVINVATGCRHGCKFCYVPTTPGLEGREEGLKELAAIDDVQDDWGRYLLYRDDLPERLRTELETREDWKCTERGRGVVMLSSGTDCYQDRRSAQITRACIQELVSHDRPVRVLTRSPAVVRDADIFRREKDLITVGSSIPTLDDELAKVMEPNAPPPTARWRALETLQKKGVRLFVSMSPTYPTMGKNEIWNTLTFLKSLDPEVIFHEPINPRGKNFEMCVKAAEAANESQLASELRKLKDHEKWVEYAVEQIALVRKLSNEIGGLEIHTWPDRELVKSTSSELRFKLSDMREAVSPEEFDGCVDVQPDSQPTLDEDISSLKSNIR